MDIKHYNIVVSGYVQGVGYRYACRKTAISYGLKGYVKNNFDGTVYIEAEGTQIQVNNLVRWCHIGPSHSQVSNVEITEDIVVGYKYFDIK